VQKIILIDQLEKTIEVWDVIPEKQHYLHFFFSMILLNDCFDSFLINQPSTGKRRFRDWLMAIGKTWEDAICTKIRF